ncbi:hypothetical protein [Leptodesmis sp.]|uniref:hypothetical protein n=1 Tax=Leptodesmis sp. TaxID=3100501 RepID=UPI004053531D
MMKLYKVKKGARNAVINRGAAESTSVFDVVSVTGTELTIQNVPKHRIFGTYWTEKKPGSNNSGFMGDSENEFTAMMEGIPFDYVDRKDAHIEFARQQKEAGGTVVIYDEPEPESTSKQEPKSTSKQEEAGKLPASSKPASNKVFFFKS